MVAYILRRTLEAIPTLLVLTIIAFGFISLAPGDAVDALFDPTAIENQNPYAAAEKRASFGLNDPVPVQYVKWLGRALQGNLGNSFIRHRPVADLIRERIGSTIVLGLSAIVVSIVIGVTVGVISGLRQYSVLDYVISIFSYGAYSFPNFFLGLVAIYVFSVRLNLLPSAGMYSVGKDATFADRVEHMILPVSVLAAQFVGLYARQTRSAVLEVLNAEYVMTAHAKGLRQRSVVLRHVLPNALIPVITVVGLSLPLVITGAVVTEVIFSWTGMGQLTVDAIYSRDYPLVMGIVLIIGIAVVAANLLVDLSYAWVDPRIRAQD